MSSATVLFQCPVNGEQTVPIEWVRIDFSESHYALVLADCPVCGVTVGVRDSDCGMQAEMLEHGAHVDWDSSDAAIARWIGVQGGPAV